MGGGLTMADLNGGILGKYNVPSQGTETQAEIITTFNSSGTLTTAAQTTAVEYLVIAGGASGGGEIAGGGGAGGYRTASGFSVSASTSYPITVGAGGASVAGSASPDAGNNGSNSVFSSTLFFLLMP